MEAPGCYALLIGGADFNITSAATYTGDWIEFLDGMVAMSAQIDFRAGTGGTDVRAYIQTSLDDGNTALDIACMHFTMADRRVINFSAINSASASVASDGSLPDDYMKDGLLGTRMRLKVVSAGGTWTNTVLAGRIVVR